MVDSTAVTDGNRRPATERPNIFPVAAGSAINVVHFVFSTGA